MYEILKYIFWLVCIFALVLFLVSVVFFIRNKLKKNVSSAKKSAITAVIALALCGAGIFGSFTAAYKQYEFDFKRLGTFKVYSDDLKDGRWADDINNQADGKNLSPELHWDSVEGASMYYIYMIDETADCWMHWQVNGTPDTELPKGLCDSEYRVIGSDNGRKITGQYIGPYPPSGTHDYTVYVFALKAEPFQTGAVNFDGQGNDIVKIAEDLNKSTYMDYNNVIGCGTITGTYTAKTAQNLEELR